MMETNEDYLRRLKAVETLATGHERQMFGWIDDEGKWVAGLIQKIDSLSVEWARGKAVLTRLGAALVVLSALNVLHVYGASEAILKFLVGVF